MPFFSIITPTFNRAHLIGKMIKSVMEQTFVDFELIIVDDGSTDHTKSHIQSYTDPRIKYVFQENGERGKARNTGVQHATGNYVFFLDSDDLIYPDHLQHAFDEIQQRNQPHFFHSRYEAVYGNRTVQLPTLNSSTIRHKIERQNQFACQFFLKRELALEFPFSENRALKIGEDWAVILHIAQRYPLEVSNKVTAAIVHHEERTMSLAKAAEIEQSRNLLITDLSADKLISEQVKGNVYAELTTLMALSYAISNQKKMALKTWWIGIKKRPSLIFTRRTLAIFKKIIFHGKA